MNLKTTLNHILIYLTIGLLVMFYFLCSQVPPLALVCVVTITVHYDCQAQQYGQNRRTSISYCLYWDERERKKWPKALKTGPKPSKKVAQSLKKVAQSPEK